jgi:hypothetical protein
MESNLALSIEAKADYVWFIIRRHMGRKKNELNIHTLSLVGTDEHQSKVIMDFNSIILHNYFIIKHPFPDTPVTL